jgi:hypothetical protein
MNEHQCLSHTTSDYNYHLARIIKYRKKVIYDDIHMG